MISPIGLRAYETTYSELYVGGPPGSEAEAARVEFVYNFDVNGSGSDVILLISHAMTDVIC